MKASFVDLRKKSSEVMRALSRNEPVTVTYRGKPVAVMQPIGQACKEAVRNVRDHPAVGMWADREDMKDVNAYIRRLRKGRFDGT